MYKRQNENGPPAKFVQRSLRDLDWWAEVAAAGVYLVTAGFPCQPWSSAGTASGSANRDGDLGRWAAAFVSFVRPCLALLENVKGILDWDHKAAFLSVVDGLRDAGFLVTWRVSNARVLAPQDRPRVFIHVLQPWADGDAHDKALRLLANTPSTPVGGYCATLDSRRVKEQLTDEQARPLLWEGPEYQQLLSAACLPWPGYQRALDGEERAPTILRLYGQAHRIPAIICTGRLHACAFRHGPHLRWLTPREVARVMGLPESFRLPADLTRAWEACGNAVVPAQAALEIGRMIAVRSNALVCSLDGLSLIHI